MLFRYRIWNRITWKIRKSFWEQQNFLPDFSSRSNRQFVTSSNVFSLTPWHSITPLLTDNREELKSFHSNWRQFHNYAMNNVLSALPLLPVVAIWSTQMRRKLKIKAATKTIQIKKCNEGLPNGRWNYDALVRYTMVMVGAFETYWIFYALVVSQTWNYIFLSLFSYQDHMQK